MFDADRHHLFAAADAGQILVPVLASGLVGTAVGLVAWIVARAMHSEDPAQETAWRYDVSRITELRRVSPLYRAAFPVIRLLAVLNRRLFRESLPEVHREIQASGLPRFWTAEEYLARNEVIAFVLLPAYAYLCVHVMGPAGIVSAAVASALTAYVLRLRLAARARSRLLRIKRRLPFLLDLLTLLMEAGSTFLQALAEAVTEFRDHPVGVEFGRVLAELSMGKSRTEALESLHKRLQDDEITSIVGSIIQGEQLGTPLASLFRTQADVLRLKRSQRAETVAGEAGVKMLLPAILVMAATVLIILGPFVLSFLYAPFMG